jgi:hypothetical protein
MKNEVRYVVVVDKKCGQLQTSPSASELFATTLFFLF